MIFVAQVFLITYKTYWEIWNICKMSQISIWIHNKNAQVVSRVQIEAAAPSTWGSGCQVRYYASTLVSVQKQLDRGNYEK